MIQSDFQAFEAVGALVVVLDVEQRIVYWNQSCSDLTGYSREEARGRMFWDFLLVPDEVEPVKARIAALQTSEHSQRSANHWVTKAGERRWIDWSNTLTRDSDGQAEYIVSTGIDRTESKRVENALRSFEKERAFLAELGAVLVATLDYEQMLAGIAHVVVKSLADCCAIDLIDSRGNLQRVKVAHRDSSRTTLCEGLRPIAIDPRRPHLISSVLQSKKPSLIAEVSPRYLESIAQSGAELRALEELAPRSLMVMPLFAHGEMLGALSLFSLSDRYGREELRLAEELASRAGLAIENTRLYEDARNHSGDLREANQHLVNATIRAHELTEEAEAARTRAEKSERELREVAEFRETFIGILGHDLRNPIGAIEMAARTLLEWGNLYGEDEKMTARILRSAERVTRMISQLLDLTRARLGGGFPLEPKPTDLRAVCRSVVDEFAAPVHLELEGDVTGIWDPDRLEEALSNILGNAIEHAAPGTPVVVNGYAEGGRVVLEIGNQGAPIPADVLPFIFEPFRGATRRATSKTGNLGLGLYIAHQIVLSHGGTLDAHSSAGTTVFVMCLPSGYVASAAPAIGAMRGRLGEHR